VKWSIRIEGREAVDGVRIDGSNVPGNDNVVGEPDRIKPQGLSVLRLRAVGVWRRSGQASRERGPGQAAGETSVQRRAKLGYQSAFIRCAQTCSHIRDKNPPDPSEDFEPGNAGWLSTSDARTQARLLIYESFNSATCSKHYLGVE
jgi:hypothetical protein